MAKRTSAFTIRIGAAYDSVHGGTTDHPFNFDRAAMRLHGSNDYRPTAEGKNLVHTLNKEVVNAYCAVHGLNSNGKDKRRQRRQRNQKHKSRRAAA